MFTGIVERASRIKTVEKNDQGMKIIVEFKDAEGSILVGDSIAVNGVCLTVTQIDGARLTFDVMNESLSNTNLSGLSNHSLINLERAMTATSRFGGHYVSGHIDFSTTILKIVNDGFAKRITFELPTPFQKYCVVKGSICIDGISLTLAAVTSDQFEVAIIPHTQDNTNFNEWCKGDVVNVEVDIVGKYIEKMMKLNNQQSATNITKSMLIENGFR